MLLYAPYWDLPPGWADLPVTERAAALVAGAERTLRNIRVREGFLNAAPLAVTSYALQQPGAVAAQNALLRPLGYPVLDARGVRAVISTAGTVLLAIGLAWQCRRVWLGRCSIRDAAWGLMLWYLLVCSQWFQPWYVLWLLGIFALKPKRAAFAVLTAWAMAAQASYLLQYIVLPNLRLSGQTLRAQLYYLLLIYGLPLAAFALASIWRRRDARIAPPGAESLSSFRSSRRIVSKFLSLGRVQGNSLVGVDQTEAAGIVDIDNLFVLDADDQVLQLVAVNRFQPQPHRRQVLVRPEQIRSGQRPRLGHVATRDLEHHHPPVHVHADELRWYAGGLFVTHKARKAASYAAGRSAYRPSRCVPSRSRCWP